MHWVDWSMIVAYIAVVTAIGFLFISALAAAWPNTSWPVAACRGGSRARR